MSILKPGLDCSCAPEPMAYARINVQFGRHVCTGQREVEPRETCEISGRSLPPHARKAGGVSAVMRGSCGIAG